MYLLINFIIIQKVKHSKNNNKSNINFKNECTITMNIKDTWEERSPKKRCDCYYFKIELLKKF